MRKLSLYIVFPLLLLSVIAGCRKDDDLGKPPEVVLFIPSAFTPNGDQVNDSFMVTGKNIETFSLTIYDLSNAVIYTSNDINRGWNGTYKSKPAPAGNYFYIVEYLIIGNPNRYQSKGYVELVR